MSANEQQTNDAPCAQTNDDKDHKLITQVHRRGLHGAGDLHPNEVD
jgi:hypothetical protein